MSKRLALRNDAFRKNLPKQADCLLPMKQNVQVNYTDLVAGCEAR